MTTAIEYRDFWSVAEEDVPHKTGARAVMDCSDIRDVLAQAGASLTGKSVLDVGCGTGRLSQLCGSWRGVDIAPAAVAYCINHGLAAEVVTGPMDLVHRYEAPWGDKPFDMVACLSVFTHISRPDRRAYLQVFRQLAPELLVDILPGSDHGSIAAWWADPAEFELDLHDGGFDDIVDTVERDSGDGYRHLYYLCR